MLGLVLAYGAMVLTQTKGAWVMEMMWGPEVASAAVSLLASKDVQPDLSYRDLCAGYSAAHYDSYSNVLHAMGMISMFWLFMYALALYGQGYGSVKPFLYLPPVYYLPAWVGHFYFQKDIPAVFTYGKTLQGWLKGETCSWEDLFAGGCVSTPTELAATLILTGIYLRTLVTYGGLWPEPKVTYVKAAKVE